MVGLGVLRPRKANLPVRNFSSACFPLRKPSGQSKPPQVAITTTPNPNGPEDPVTAGWTPSADSSSITRPNLLPCASVAACPTHSAAQFRVYHPVRLAGDHSCDASGSDTRSVPCARLRSVSRVASGRRGVITPRLGVPSPGATAGPFALSFGYVVFCIWPCPAVPAFFLLRSTRDLLGSRQPRSPSKSSSSADSDSPPS